VAVFYAAVSRQQKWHRLTPLVRGDLQVFSCMQENSDLKKAVAELVLEVQRYKKSLGM
jgi:hypothetical protein